MVLIYLLHVLLWTPRSGQTSVDQLAKTYIHQLCVDTVYCQKRWPIVKEHVQPIQLDIDDDVYLKGSNLQYLLILHILVK